MIKIFLFLLALILPFIAGYSITSFLKRSERIIISFPLGAGIFSFYIFALGYARIKMSLFPLLLFFVPFIILFIKGITQKHLGKKFEKKRFSEEFKKLPANRKIILIFIISLFVWKSIFSFFMAVSAPSYFDDVVGNWNRRAKVFYFEKSLILDKKNPLFLGLSYQDYPLHAPLIKMYFAEMVGQWDEKAINLYQFIFFFLSAFFIFVKLFEHTNLFLSALFSYFAVSLPLFTFHAFSAYSDIIVGFFVLLSISYLFDFMQKNQIYHLILSAVFIALAGFTKNEGMVLFFPAVFIPFILFSFSSKKKIKKILLDIFYFLGIYLILLGPYLYMKFSFSLGLTAGYSKGSQLEFHPEVLKIMPKVLFFEGNFNLFWFLFIFLCAVYFKKIIKTKTKYLFIFIILAIGAITASFVFTGNYIFALNQTTINRTFIIIMPAISFILGLTYENTEKT